MSSPTGRSTVTLNLRQREELLAQPFLYGLFEADQPLHTGFRRSLAGVDRLTVGREPEPPGERLVLPDLGMSSTHARLCRTEQGWCIEDLQSKNGTLVNGKRVTSALLADGNLIETGHTFFLFRDSVLPPTSGQADLQGTELARSPAGLATFLPSLADAFTQLAEVAASKVPIVLGGETGAGKEVVASAIHELSKREGPFVPLNCAALPTTLVESELFGYRKGAFSGAMEDRPGLVRGADGGTLFLDELGDLPLGAQATLLRVLQQEEVMPIGGTRPVKVDLRVVVATHRDLGALVERGEFRADLLARVAGFSLVLPPLRQRREDVGLLIAALLQRQFRERSRSISFSSEAARALLTYHWPRNIRELEKCLTTAVVLARGGRVEINHLPAGVREPPVARPPPMGEGARKPLTKAEARIREQLIAALRAHRGNVTVVGKAMGKARSQIQRWMRRFGIDLEQFRP